MVWKPLVAIGPQDGTALGFTFTDYYAAGQVESFEVPDRTYGSKWVRLPGKGTS